MGELEQKEGAGRPGFGLHVIFLAWIVVVLAVGLVRHRSIAELWEDAASGPVEQRPEALQALAQRVGPVELARQFPAALFDAEDARLREFAFTNTFSRSPLTTPEQKDLLRITDPAERFRAALWLHCRSATPRRITWADLDTWFDEKYRPRD